MHFSMAQEMTVDWGQGLPLDVLGLVAKAGGLHGMKAMREVSRDWQQGFELGVCRVTVRIARQQRALPSRDLTFQRFPLLTRLDISESTISEAWLQTLHTFPRLNSLALGCQTNRVQPSNSNSLGTRLTDAGLTLLRGLSLTRLRLSRCDELTELGALVGMRLTALDLSGCLELNPAALYVLKEVPLTQLSFKSTFFYDIPNLSLNCLSGMALQSLDLSDMLDTDVMGGKEIDALLEPLRGTPLTRLGLRFWSISNAGLEHLRGLPLKILDLYCCAQLENLEPLRGMPLTVLGLNSCLNLTNTSLAALRGMAITSMDLSGSPWLTEFGLLEMEFLDMPLIHLNVSYCCMLSDEIKTWLLKAGKGVYVSQKSQL